MKRIILPMAGTLALFAAVAAHPWTQNSVTAATLVTRVSGAYRRMQSYSETATIKNKLGKKETEASLTLAMQRPNRYLMELKGEKLNTVILNDGSNLIALRPDRKAYTKSKAPAMVMGSNLIGTVDVPSPGAHILTQLLAGNLRETTLGKAMLSGKVEGPQPFGSKYAYVLTFRYDDEHEGKVFITEDDNLVRQIKLLKDGALVWQEDHDELKIDKPIPADTFTRPITEGARVVLSLPKLEKPEDVAEEGDEESGIHAKVKRGIAVFRMQGCGRCHAIKGEGGQFGPDLTEVGAVEEHTAKWLAEHVRNPKTHNPGSTMPAFGNKLSEKDLEAIGLYLSTLK